VTAAPEPESWAMILGIGLVSFAQLAAYHRFDARIKRMAAGELA